MSAAEMYTPKSSKSKVAEYDIKSGTDSKTAYVKALGGLPEKKSVEAIDKENTPKRYANAVGN